MKSFFTAILCFLLLLGSFVSCNPHSSAIESATFDSLAIDTIKPLFSSCDKPACHLIIKMEVPVDPTPKATCSAIERFVSQLPKDGTLDEEAEGSIEMMVNAYARHYILDYLTNGTDAIDNYGGDTLAAANWMSYEEKVLGSVLYNKDGFLSYQVRTESYTGGAHGNAAVTNDVLDYATLMPVNLGDLFTEASLPLVNEKIQEDLVRQYSFSTMEELEASGLFFSPSEVEATENFYVDQQGVTWMYDPYDIAPYSTGEVSVSLAWKDIVSLLNSDSPLQAMAQQYSATSNPQASK